MGYYSVLYLLIGRVLLLVSCFRRKFSNILSEKEILGSKNVLSYPSYIFLNSFWMSSLHYSMAIHLFYEVCVISFMLSLWPAFARCPQKEGLAQFYARSYLPVHSFRPKVKSHVVNITLIQLLAKNIKFIVCICCLLFFHFKVPAIGLVVLIILEAVIYCHVLSSLV